MSQPASGRFGPIEIIPGEYSEQWRMVRSCTLVVESGGERAIIDPAADEARLSSLVPGATLCINSHPHADHILFNPMFPHVPLCAPARDAHFYDPCDLSEMGPDAESIVGEYVSRRAGKSIRRPDRLLADGDIFSIGAVEVQVVAIPGHTAGIVCFHFPTQRLAYISDFDLTEFGPWYGNASSDPDAFVASGRRLEALDVDRYVTSHEVGIVDREALPALLATFLAHIPARDERLYDRLAEPRSLSELSTGDIVYSTSAVARSPWLALWERQHVRKHLARLARVGQITQTEAGLHCRR
jgi:glyoxylase-like metal-dependent hydrolase (beta-lactamase superfamily II)